MGRAFLVNSLPSLSKNDLSNLINEMSNYAGNLFVTDAAENVYESFGGDWEDFVDIVAGLA